MNLSDRIKAAQEQLVKAKDDLLAVTKQLEDTPDDDSLLAQCDQLSLNVETQTKSLESLQKAESALATRAAATPAIVTAKHLGGRADADVMFKSIAAVAEAHVKRVSVESIVADRYKSDDAISSVVKSVTAPAYTNVTGWAQELVRETYGAFMDTIKPESVIPKLGMNTYSFDGFQSIKIPMRAGQEPNLAGAFRTEGSPIPVKQLGFTSKILTPKSMGVISAFSNELFERSTPNILDIIRSAIISDTAIALDTKFLSSDAAITGEAPAGIQNGLAAGNTAASTGNTVADIYADLRARLQAMSSVNLGRKPVWIMNPARAWGLQLAVNAVGAPAFPEIATSNTLIGAPVVTSTNVPADVVYLVDAAELYFAGGVPQFYGTDVATLHMESATPLEITGNTSPASVASPVRSLYQTNTAAIRAVWQLDWTVNRAGCVQTITGCAW
ncbi:major_cap_HK97, phage major capsid protein, HK97 family [uncultured Caudovirales phage]|uniref:Major_cap_HK97, phage major capsid protein, HK97 family n=1 Tax=uncultured Caudovirales phage TaxID=2100421 RepID=A0A6J5LH19_9CAUD|nr:major_cap_HK97, phage major capsid protein, HK97 family [uncultured Caudovirales phage]